MWPNYGRLTFHTNKIGPRRAPNMDYTVKMKFLFCIHRLATRRGGAFCSVFSSFLAHFLPNFVFYFSTSVQVPILAHFSLLSP